jgi:hypothetical protein
MQAASGDRSWVSRPISVSVSHFGRRPEIVIPSESRDLYEN